MGNLQEERARELVEQLECAGINYGLLTLQETVVLRCPYIDTPMMMFVA